MISDSVSVSEKSISSNKESININFASKGEETSIIIESYTFYNCDGLTDITIPNGVTEIREGAFLGCDNLTTVTIPSSVTLLENSNSYSKFGSPFRQCKKLTSINVESGNLNYSSKYNLHEIGVLGN